MVDLLPSKSFFIYNDFSILNHRIQNEGILHYGYSNPHDIYCPNVQVFNTD